jgi:hypothetical protein
MHPIRVSRRADFSAVSPRAGESATDPGIQNWCNKNVTLSYTVTFTTMDQTIKLPKSETITKHVSYVVSSLLMYNVANLFTGGIARKRKKISSLELFALHFITVINCSNLPGSVSVPSDLGVIFDSCNCDGVDREHCRGSPSSMMARQRDLGEVWPAMPPSLPSPLGRPEEDDTGCAAAEASSNTLTISSLTAAFQRIRAKIKTCISPP